MQIMSETLRSACLSALGLAGDVSIRQHTLSYVSMRQHASAYVSIRHHMSAYVSVRQRTSAV